MLLRTDIRTPFGGKPRLLPDLLRLRRIRSSIMGDYRLHMAAQDARLRQVEEKMRGGEKRPYNWIDWISSGCCPNDNAAGRAERAAWRAEMAEWHKYFKPRWKDRTREVWRVLVFLGSIAAAMLLLTWLSRP